MLLRTGKRYEILQKDTKPYEKVTKPHEKNTKSSEKIQNLTKKIRNLMYETLQKRYDLEDPILFCWGE